MIKILLLLFLPLLADAQNCPLCGSIEIKVTGLKSDTGVVRVMLTRDASQFEERSLEKLQPSKLYFRNEKARKSGLSFRFPELPAGRYAYKIFHDENQNKVLDTSLLGKPLEGVAQSGTAKITASASFQEAAFELKARQKLSLISKMQYFGTPTDR